MIKNDRKRIPSRGWTEMTRKVYEFKATWNFMGGIKVDGSWTKRTTWASLARSPGCSAPAGGVSSGGFGYFVLDGI